MPGAAVGPEHEVALAIQHVVERDRRDEDDARAVAPWAVLAGLLAKLACEPAGAAAVAALLAGKLEPALGEPAVAVVSGGNADPATVAGILAGR